MVAYDNGAVALMGLRLNLVNYKTWRECKLDTNIKWFKTHFGPTPITAKNIWCDITRYVKDPDPANFLQSLRFLWLYPTEEQSCALFNTSAPTVRKYIQIYCAAIQKLLLDKVRLKKMLYKYAVINF